MIIVDQIKCQINDDLEHIQSQIVKKLRISANDCKSCTIIKRSVDARKKPDIYYVYSVVVDLGNLESSVLKRFSKDSSVRLYELKEYKINTSVNKSQRPVVVGAGPAGLFCMYILTLAGLNPVCFERGKSVDERTNDVIDFWNTGILKPNSNVQFGEGGAGTFSDGKLNTLVKDHFGRNKFVLDTFVKYGANSNILIDAKPHIGTDSLVSVIKNIRNDIIAKGGEFHFNTEVSDFVINDNTLRAIKCKDLIKDEEYIVNTDSVVLAIGHSARNTFETLNARGVYMEAKDFAVGFRIEHPRNAISEAMYGPKYSLLPPASYKLAHTFDNGRGVYSFCMCPGGFVVNASSEPNRLVVNGMSYSQRDSRNSNSAIVISVGAGEYEKEDPLSAVKFQRYLEEKAYNLCAGAIPQQLYSDFKAHRLTSGYGDFESETKGKVAFGQLDELFTKDMNDSFIAAMNIFAGKIKGFDRGDAILSGVESRTSSPVRISRAENFNSNIKGLYPCGEGAGYAGGIMSAAMDGMKVAEAIING